MTTESLRVKPTLTLLLDGLLEPKILPSKQNLLVHPT